MKTKPYPPYEEQPMVAGEPTVAYQRTDPATYCTSYSSKRDYMQEELDELEAECLRPMTMADIHRRIDEAEAEIEAGEGQTAEEFFAELRRDLYGSVAMPRASQYQLTPYQMEVLQRSEEDSKAGRVHSQEEVDKMLERWLK